MTIKPATRMYLYTALVVLWMLNGMSCSRSNQNSAVQTVEHWLALLDTGKYTESWNGLSELYKQNDTVEKWVDHFDKYHKPLGKLLERKLIDQTTTSLTEAPEGEYIIFQYQSAFENKKNVSEAVSVVKDMDGQWRILGYFIDVSQQ